MGCQCANQKEQDLDDDVMKKNSLQEELEKDLDNNNMEQKGGIFGLTNQENTVESPLKVRASNNANENNLNNGYVQENQENIQKNYGGEKKYENKNGKYSDFPKKILELINRIRDKPSSYAEVIEESINNIIEEPNEEDENNPKLIYKHKVKVALVKGEPAFREAAEKLREMSSLPPLELKSDICVPLPETEEEIRDPSYLKEHVKIIRETNNVDVFFKDLIKIPEVSALLMIVDDSSKNPGRKRQAVLSKIFKYIGISSKFVGNTFIAYFTFSSE